MDEYEHISDYFNGLLSAAEMARFDENIQQDPAFAENVAFYLQAIQELKGQVAAEKKGRFRELYERTKQTGNKENTLSIFRGKWAKIAVAAALVLCIAMSWLWWPQSSARALADKYVQDNFASMNITMGNNNDSLQVAAGLYNEGKWNQALIIFERLAEDSTRAAAIKNAGIVALRLKEYDKAMSYFIQLENNHGLSVNPGTFYHAICLLERNGQGDRAEAQRLLNMVVKKNLPDAQAAAKLLERN
jgi:tetratricopeptide (TPR) repeat protein